MVSNLDKIRRSLSSAQMTYMLRRRFNNMSTIKALKKRGLVDEYGSFTDLGYQLVKSIKDKQTLKNVEHEGLEVVADNDEQLLEIVMSAKLSDKDFYINAYRGNVPFVEVGIEKIGLLDSFYFWKISVNKSAGKFLTEGFVYSHKGTRVFYMRDVNRYATSGPI